MASFSKPSSGPALGTVPPEDYVTAWQARIEDELKGLVSEEEPAALYDPVRYVLAGKGKRVRPLLVLLTCAGFEGDPEDAVPAALSVEAFHAFTLVHDDIMDHSAQRRGRATIHTRWDESSAILAGDYLMALAYRLLTRNTWERPDAALEAYHTMVVRLCEGQALDKDFEERRDVRMSDYMRMIDCKTGALLAASFKLGGLAAGATDEAVATLAQIGTRAGRAFQIQDDLLDLTADDHEWGKPIGADLMEAKKTYLLLRALEKMEGNERAWFTNIVEGKGLRGEDIPEARRRFRDAGVLRDAQSAVHRLIEEAFQLLDTLDLGESSEPLIWLLRRTEKRVH